MVGRLSLEEIAGNTYFVVEPTESNYYKTVLSWDDKPEYTYNGEEGHIFGLEFFEHYYKSIMVDCIGTSEEICSLIDWTKSPGWPHTYFGFRTKEELVSALSQTMFSDRVGTLAIHNVAGKVEFKKLEEIEQDKIRCFQIPSFELLYSQLKFGKRISLRLMNFHWSYYGFNPYKGGFDKLANRLLLKQYRGCYDVSGWDKFLPLLPEIYAILKRNLGKISEEDLDEFMWCARYTCEFLLKTMNGNVFRKTYGNASGSGCTTRDNIFGHIIIFASGLYKAFVQKQGYSPHFSDVYDQLVSIYGDDNVYAVDEEFSYMCDKDFLSGHLSTYGLKLKFFFGGLNCDLHTLSFLGASFKWFNNRWYPLYDVERLATTMLYERNHLNLGQHLGKAFTLMVMSRPSDKFDVFYRAYETLVNSEKVQNNCDDPTVRRYASVGLPEISLIDAFYCGSESACLDDLVLAFYPDLLADF
jgi:hypothetical protein